MHSQSINFDERYRALLKHTKLKSESKNPTPSTYKTKTRLEYEKKLKLVNQIIDIK